jgi:hypothetical protein
MPTFKSRRSGIDLRTVFPPAETAKMKEVVRAVVNGLEDLMDKHEDRMLTGGPKGESTIMNQNHEYILHLDDERFVVTIQKREK